MPKYSASSVDHDTRLWIANVLSDGAASEQHLQSHFPAVDLERALHLAQTEGVAALLSHRLQAKQQWHNVPAEFITQLKNLEMESAALNLRREVEVKRFFGLFQDAELEFIVLKGEALAHSLYPSPHLRSRCDIDLLFRDKPAAEEAWSILQKHGYARKATLEGEFVGFQYSCTRTLVNGLSITFDIHNQISDYLWFARRYPFDELFDNSELISHSGLKVKCLDKTYALMHACLHRIGNKPHRIENRLIWIYDIHLLANAFTEQDWIDLPGIAARKDMSQACLDGLALAKSLFGSTVPGPVMTALGQAAEGERIGLGNIDNRWRLYVNDFMNNKGVRNKLRQLREHILPSVSYMMNKYSLKTKYLLPYYYCKRVFQGLFKYI